MTIYEDMFCRIAFENNQITAVAKALRFSLDYELTVFFTEHDSFTLDGTKYKVKVKDNAYASERYICFVTEDDNLPDWLVIIRYGYRLIVEKLDKPEENRFSEVSDIGEHKYFILIPEEEQDRINTLLDEGFFWKDYDVITGEGEEVGYYRKYHDGNGYEVWITYAEYGRIKCGLPVIVEGVLVG